MGTHSNLHLLLNAGSKYVMEPMINTSQLSVIFCGSWGFERLRKSEDSFKDCSENVNIMICILLPRPLGNDPRFIQ